MGGCGLLTTLIGVNINRVLFPGGGSSLVESAYLEAAETIFTLAKQVREERKRKGVRDKGM